MELEEVSRYPSTVSPAGRAPLWYLYHIWHRLPFCARRDMLSLLFAATAAPLDEHQHALAAAAASLNGRRYAQHVVAPRDEGDTVSMKSVPKMNNRVNELAPDYAWVNVDRWSTNVCAARECNVLDYSNCMQAGSPFSEGLSAGFPTDCGDEYAKAGYPEAAKDCNASYAKVNYGCWFVMMPQTVFQGASVNVGRSLRVNDRGEAAKALGLPCGNPPVCDGKNQPWDKMWCTEAQKRGYDSIQVHHPKNPEFESELVVCKGCDKVALNGACPPIELRRPTWDGRGMGPGGPCNCSNAADNLNCGDEDAFMYCHNYGA